MGKNKDCKLFYELAQNSCFGFANISLPLYKIILCSAEEFRECQHLDFTTLSGISYDCLGGRGRQSSAKFSFSVTRNLAERLYVFQV